MELLDIVGVSKDVVAVDSLHVALFNLGTLQSLECLIFKDSHVEVASGVFLLLDRPVSVIVIQSVEIVVKILIDLKISNL